MSEAPSGHADRADVGGALQGEPPPIQQALFGYDAGHRLLESSQPLDQMTSSLLSRLTDGTGATDFPGFDGHLAAYPLADGRFALSRTWAAPEAPRPGAVWTHVLLLEQTHFSGGFDPTKLTGLLLRPSDSPGYKHELAVPSADPTTVQLDLEEPDGWRAAVAALFAEDDKTVWMTARESRSLEPSLLALWAWQWPSLRRQFAFSLGATGRRKVGTREFDFVVVPEARRLSAQADLGALPSTRTLAGDLIADSVAKRAPSSFGLFCRFCGAETSGRSAASMLALAWHTASGAPPGPASANALLTLADQAAVHYPDPRKMRRYKRLLLVPDHRLPASWTADDAMRALTTTTLGRATAAADVDADALTSAVTDPGLLAAAAAAPPAATDSGSDVATVADALGPAARRVIAKSATPSWLPVLAATAPDTVTVLLTAPPLRSKAAWAKAYWALPAQRRRAVAGPHTSPKLTWLAAHATSRSAGQALLAERCGSLSPHEALDSFSEELSRLPNAKARSWTAAIADETVAAAAVAVAPHLPAAGAAALLAALSPAASLVKEAGLRPWRELAMHPIPPMTAVSALLLTPENRPNKVEILLAARSYAIVWRALSEGDGGVWSALGDYPSSLGPDAEWDRARRVTYRFAATLLAWDRERATVAAVGQAAAAARREHPEAADQLVEELIKAAESRFARKKKGRRRKSMVEKVIEGLRSVAGL